MQELQEKLIETMDVFHAFCAEHGLTYYMLGGTMLGAVRHRGFIPWDDDMDLGMPRADYEKFLSLRNQMPDGYRIRHHRFETGVPYAFAHFEDTRTTYIEQRRSKDSYVGGVSLEIFPLDETVEDIRRRKWNSYKVRYHKRILYGLILDYRQKKRVWYKALIIKGIRLFGSVDRTTKNLDRCINTGISDGTRFSNLLGHWGIREDIPKEVFGSPVLYEFAGRQYYGVTHPKQYLTALYGDTYMIPPSEEEKEAGKHPAAYMDLHMPYAEYVKNK